MQTALIVDDESLIAMSAADLFQAAGYETIEACSADKAIRQLESNANIAIVFTDIRMPGSMDGLQLAHLVRDRWSPGAAISPRAVCSSRSRTPASRHNPRVFLLDEFARSVQADVRRIGPKQGSSVRFRASRALRAIAESAAQLR